jgi:hypothetical protein
MACDGSCKECVGPSAGECISCKKGKYLKRAVPATLTITYGTCETKSGTGTYTVYVRTSFGYSPFPPPAATVQSMGTSVAPFIHITDAIAKAYELGAPNLSAEVSILLLATSDSHLLRPYK